MCLEQIKTVTDILANSVAIFGVVGAFFVIRQWQLANSQWRFQLYDKRYVVYQAMLDFINAALAGKSDTRLLVEYVRKVQAQEFLFGAEIRAAMAELYVKANELATCESLLNQTKEAANTQNYQQRREELCQWFVQQPERIKKLFAKVLSVRE